MKKTKIIIVGAGIAGLAAANCLQEAGVDVLLLEARERAGGRIWPDDSLGVPLDKGAAWVHGTEGNPMVELANRYNSRIRPIDLSRFLVFDKAGKIISGTVRDSFEQNFEEHLKKAEALAFHSEKDLPLSEALSVSFKPDDLSEQEQRLFQLKLGFFEGYIGANYEHLSARHWNHETALPGDNAILSDSYAPILRGLAKNVSVRFHTVVKEIIENENGIEIRTEQETFQADAVLVTVSLGVLKKKTLFFSPPLSRAKQTAFEKLGMGSFDILALKFPRVFWPEDSHVFSIVNTHPLAASIFVNFYPYHQQPVLLSYFGGERALRAEQHSEDELISATLADLRNCFETVEEPEAYFFTRWSQDPYSYGSYSYAAVGAELNDYDELAKPASDRLFFAGEATMRDFPASTHGAYWSGLREANRILTLYGHAGS